MARAMTEQEVLRRLYLLWGRHPAPGRSGITVDAIVEAAIVIADADGLDAASMRRVAEHLGVGTMSLYGHVPSRGDLVALMADRVHGELDAGVVPDATASGGWREGMRAVATQTWDLYRRHPWLHDVGETRIVGPQIAHKYERELRPLDGIGLTDLQMDSSLTLLLSVAVAAARSSRDGGATTDASGMSDAEWWAIVAPALGLMMDDADYPVSGRVGVTVGQEFQAVSNPLHALEFGVDTVLDGVARLLP